LYDREEKSGGGIGKYVTDGGGIKQGAKKELAKVPGCWGGGGTGALKKGTRTNTESVRETNTIVDAKTQEEKSTV